MLEQMPNPVEERVLLKTIPVTASCAAKTLYTFHGHDEIHSTAEIDTYRFPYSPGTFWVNFRVRRSQGNGILCTERIRIRLVVRTAAEDVIELLPWRMYHPPSWYSTRWPLPSLPFSNSVGIWLEVEHQEQGVNHVELQGFDGLSPRSNKYVLVDEEDRHRLLFQQEHAVRTGPENTPWVASIHDLFDDELPATHGISPTEIDGIPLFPLALLHLCDK